MEVQNKWVINKENTEFWEQPYEFESREDVIFYGKEYLGVINDLIAPKDRYFYIGQKEQYTPYVDPESIIDAITDEAAGEVGEISHNWLEKLSSDEIHSLGEKLNTALHEWIDETGNTPDFYKIINVEKVEF